MVQQSIPKLERWNISGILRHIGGAEWWHWERIGYPFPEDEKDVPEEPFERLVAVRDHFNFLLPKIETVNKVPGLDGEIWIPLNLLRQAPFHGKTWRTEHIRRRLA